jgi:hypothetical protein
MFFRGVIISYWSGTDIFAVQIQGDVFMSEESEKLEKLINAYKETAKQLESVKGKSEEEISNTMSQAMSSVHVCCNACQAVSSICVPDKTPNKCKGGCTITSFAF